MTRPRVVIVGAGVAGIAAAVALRDRPWRSPLVDVTVLDERNHHVLAPMLYGVVAGRARPEIAARPVRSLLHGLPNVAFRQARVQSIQPRLRRVETDRGSIPYDYLIVAAGSVEDHRDLVGPMLGIGDLAQAVELRDHIASCREAATWASAAERARLLTIAVVGGGMTGLELAAGLAARGARGGGGVEVTVVVLEAADPPAGLPRAMATAVVPSVRERGVRVELGARVTTVDERGVALENDQRIDAGTVIWAGGMRANPLAEGFAATGDHGRVLVRDTLQTDHYPEIFVVGDMAEPASPTGERPQMTGGVALCTGRHAADVVRRMASGRDVRPLGARHRGMFVNVGPREAVAQVGPLQLTGMLGKLAWLGLDLLPLTGRRTKSVLVAHWAAGAMRPASRERVVLGAAGALRSSPAVEPARERVDLPSVNVGNADDFGRSAALSWWTSELPNQRSESGPPPGSLAAGRAKVLRLRQALFGIKSDTQDDYSR